MNYESIDWAAVTKYVRERYTSPDHARRELIDPALRLIPRTQTLVGSELKPKVSKYCPYQLSPKQEEFLRLDCLDAFYGGAAGGGKSVALLEGALQFADVPGYSALLLRRTFSELNMPKALMSMAREWLGGGGPQWREHEKTWYFPNPAGPAATLTFGYLENSDDRFRYQSSAFAYIGIDEITEFRENDATFLFSRLRRDKAMDVPLRFRGASNPTGDGRLWVKSRYVDVETRGDRIFIPAKLDDNPGLSKEDYVRGLMNLDPITRAQVLEGDWEAQASGKFRRHWFKIVQIAPYMSRYVRFWDLAATEDRGTNDPSWTVGTLMGQHGHEFVIVDIQRARLSPKDVEDLVIQTAATDKQTYGHVPVRIEQEPGSSGKTVIAHFTNLLAGYDIQGERVTGPKEIRANALASQAQAGNVYLMAADWLKVALDEFESFPFGGHNDIVDSSSGAFNFLTAEPPLNTKGIIMVGERIRPDW